MSKQLTSREYLSQLNLIYFVQAGVMLVFAAVVFALVYLGEIVTTTDESFSQTATYALVAIVIAGFSAAHFLYQFMLSKIDKALDIKKKMPKYLGALLIRSACLELPGLAASVIFFMIGNYYLLLIPLFTALVFFLLRPTAGSIAEDLNLTTSEKDLLKDPNAIVVEH